MYELQRLFLMRVYISPFKLISCKWECLGELFMLLEPVPLSIIDVPQSSCAWAASFSSHDKKIMKRSVDVCDQYDLTAGLEAFWWEEEEKSASANVLGGTWHSVVSAASEVLFGF